MIAGAGLAKRKQGRGSVCWKQKRRAGTFSIDQENKGGKKEEQ